MSGKGLHHLQAVHAHGMREAKMIGGEPRLYVPVR
jgi:hypothetical protein